MLAIDFVLGAALLVFVAVVFSAAIVGLMGALGAVRLARCGRCRHLAVGPPHSALTSCPYCRHDHLMHPVHTVHEVLAHPVIGMRAVPGLRELSLHRGRKPHEAA